ncbi:hypothetical protein [endosymbiont GvMRE of Glomus versiforme]|uniref:hypothetical protein n=1 Tax=endosymbiont GvMRE of Glomus versiforme TaxID=2039283 RepID=UPI000EC340D3|nr:hypothetical protein [endosymbiont GvMRE of Glomus versiforme]RHZ36480.1 hypothetical protein GvMRE_I2g519 [endosymbiont GvMRE of Glomus versiforme]
MNRNRENQKCPKTNCWGKIVEKEVYHDVSPFDAYNETTYSISVCNNSDCGSRSDKCFWVTVRDIQEDGVLVGTPKHVWKESISPETLAKNLVDFVIWLLKVWN